MHNGHPGYPATLAHSGAGSKPAEAEISLLDSLRGALVSAHDRVCRLENLADRVFGEEPSNAAIGPESNVIGGALLVSAHNLIERLNVAVTRLERIA